MICGSDYFNKLDKECKMRYLSKVSLIDGRDPYTLKWDQFSEDPAILPPLSHADITIYLLHTTSFVTLEEVKNYKSLQSYRYFTAGWVVEHKWKLFTDCCLVVGKVNHSYTLSSPALQPWAIIRSSGVVSCGHCTCMAGLGETCSHVGALLYYVEYQVRRYTETSSTSKPNTWLEPCTVKQAPYLRLEDISFTSAEQTMKEHRKLQQSPKAVPSTELPQHDKPDQSDILELYEKCSSVTSMVPIFFSLEDAHCKSFVHSDTHLPVQYQSLYDPEHLELNYLELVEAGEKMSGLFDLTSVQQKHLEELTRGQLLSKLWIRFRAGRITASRLYQVVHSDPHKPAISLVYAICYPETIKFTTKATLYGCKHEDEAVDKYKLAAVQKHKNLKITPAGLVLKCQKACFGASPDSFVECDCCGPGVLEAKCPYCAQDKGFEEVAENHNFCLAKNADGEMMLKRTHSYYYQCQMQVAVTGRCYCDFIVWSVTGELHCERIFPDADFISQQLELAEKFFHLAVLPELIGKWFTRGHTALPVVTVHCDENVEEDDGSWCYCQEIKGGDMIGCENESCSIKWFHKECLRIKKGNDPKGKWLCPTCHAMKKLPKKHSRDQ